MEAAIGKDLRDAGMDRTISHEKAEWKKKYAEELELFLAQKPDVFLSEDFRKWFLARGNNPPHHPNVWGACWNGFVKRGRIKRTGGYRNSSLFAQSHASIQPEWTIGNGASN